MKILKSTLSLTFFLFAVLTLCVSVSAAEKPQIKVMTFNIHHAEGMDKVVDLARIAEIINKTAPDIAAIQEVDNKTERTSKIDQAAELGNLTKMQVSFGKAINFQGGEYGQILLHKPKLKSFETLQLPNQDKNEQRIALVASLDNYKEIPPFTFIGTHLENTSLTASLPQAQALVEKFGKTSPIIIAGDFNSNPNDQTIKFVSNTWADATSSIKNTFETEGKIDYIFYGCPDQWKVIECKLIDSGIASDHKAISVILEWQGKL
ncbi:MAG: endonuclease/exonuclease/phosphatase family protein [Lentisphaerota bacterium]